MYMSLTQHLFKTTVTSSAWQPVGKRCLYTVRLVNAALRSCLFTVYSFWVWIGFRNNTVDEVFTDIEISDPKLVRWRYKWQTTGYNFHLRRMATSWNICNSLKWVTFLTHPVESILQPVPKMQHTATVNGVKVTKCIVVHCTCMDRLLFYILARLPPWTCGQCTQQHHIHYHALLHHCRIYNAPTTKTRTCK